MKNIPFLLIYSRILIAIIIAIITFLSLKNSDIIIVSLMTVGLFTDVFDGIIARKLNVSSENLRIWDSNVDQFFWMMVITSVFYLNFPFIRENYLPVAVIIGLEISAYIISYAKFNRPIATHSILAKLWTITLLAFLIDLTLHSDSNLPFEICAILGIISRVEIILIILGLEKWTTDVPSVLSVRKINKGLPVSKSKLFNS
jgi:phosphatidylglycerophosphate synthase